MSISPIRSEAVRKYFIETPIKPEQPDNSGNQNQMIGGGVLLFVALFLFISGNGLLVLLGMAAGYFGFRSLSKGYSESSEKKTSYEQACARYQNDYAKAEPKPSDEQMDRWMSSDIENIIKESLKRLGLEHDDYKAHPFLLGGPADLQETQLAVGRDGKIRYSHLNILIVFLTEHNIASYQCTHNLIYGQTLDDNTQEFPYKEITNLQIKTINKKISIVNGRREFANGVQQFALYTAGANVIEVVYSFSQSADFNGELVKVGSEDTIAVIRKKLEEYKKKYER